MSATAKNCGHCQKSSLSLLLLRPGPIATHSDLQPIGAAHAVADEALVKPFIAQGLTDSRPVLRLLRAGYVHAYIPKTGRWRTWRVTEQADLLAQDHPLFAVPAVDATCTRKAHNASGFKLLALPDAHTLVGQPIWLAFSANLWSGKLKTQNQANPKAMVQITLGTAAAPAFKPDAQSLKRQMLECNALHWRLPKADPGLQPVFAFNSLAMDAQVQHLAQTLQLAASSHPQTAGHELAVVLPDPAGYAAELNALRLARFELARQEAARPENAHPLTSLQMLDGLRQIVVDEKEARSFDAVSPTDERGRLQGHHARQAQPAWLA